MQTVECRQEGRCSLSVGGGGWQREGFGGFPVAWESACADSFLDVGALTAQNRERRDGGDWSDGVVAPVAREFANANSCVNVASVLQSLGSSLTRTPSSGWGFSPHSSQPVTPGTESLHGVSRRVRMATGAALRFSSR